MDYYISRLKRRAQQFEHLRDSVSEDDLDELMESFGEDSVSEVLSGKKERKQEKQIQFLASALVRAQAELDELRAKERLAEQRKNNPLSFFWDSLTGEDS